MIADKQATLDRIAAYDHSQRQDIKDLAKAAFEERIESVLLKWMLQIKDCGPEQCGTYSDTFILHEPFGFYLTHYESVVRDLHFEVIPAELVEDVKASNTAAVVQRSVERIVFKHIRSMLKRRIKLWSPDLAPGYTPQLTYNSASDGSCLSVRLKMKPNATTRIWRCLSCHSC